MRVPRAQARGARLSRVSEFVERASWHRLRTSHGLHALVRRDGSARRPTPRQLQRARDACRPFAQHHTKCLNVARGPQEPHVGTLGNERFDSAVALRMSHSLHALVRRDGSARRPTPRRLQRARGACRPFGRSRTKRRRGSRPSRTLCRRFGLERFHSADTLRAAHDSHALVRHGGSARRLTPHPRHGPRNGKSDRADGRTRSSKAHGAVRSRSRAGARAAQLRCSARVVRLLLASSLVRAGQAAHRPAMADRCGPSPPLLRDPS